MNRSRNGRTGHRLRSAGWTLLMLATLCIAFTITFFLTGLLYDSIGVRPPAWLIQLINSILGLVLMALVVSSVLRLSGRKQIESQMGVFGPLIAAMERIAKGDFSVRIDPGRKDDGPFNGVIGELVKSVNNMALELDQMESLRQEFTSNVSHEIQSPLTSIRGFAQALQNDHLAPEERAHFLSVIETESTRLSRITYNLLKLAALDSEHAKFAPKPYPLGKQIRSLILACEPQWMDKDIDMDVAVDELTIIADEDLLSQVWINLIHNSIKFTPREGHIRIELHASRASGAGSPCGDRIEFRICDTGIGIAEEDQARIFERFYKSDKSRERSQGGSGLGLSIARKIVEMHKGTIAVQSKLGEGSVFTVCLPAAADR